MARFDRRTENRAISAANDVAILLDEENELEDGERRLSATLHTVVEALEALNNDAGERMEQAAARYGRAVEIAADRANEDDVTKRPRQVTERDAEGKSVTVTRDVPVFRFLFPTIRKEARKLQTAKGEAAIVASMRALSRLTAQQAKDVIAFVRREGRLVDRDARRQQLPATSTNKRRKVAGLSGWRW